MLSNFNETEETELLCCKLRHGSFFFPPQEHIANYWCHWSGDGFAALRPGESGWVWV